MITINFNQFEYAVATCPAAGMAGDTHIHCATTTCRQTFFEANWTAIQANWTAIQANCSAFESTRSVFQANQIAIQTF